MTAALTRPEMVPERASAGGFRQRAGDEEEL